MVPGQFERIYGVDINGDYLDECQRRYNMLGAAFRPIETDLTGQALTLPRADLLVANLLIEYIGYDHFKRAVKLAGPRYVSCVIQVNTESEAFVSASPYLHAFDRLCEVHHPVAEDSLTEAMAEIGYKMVLKEERELPNGKKLVRLDYRFVWDESAGAGNPI
ncbi:class I SAM-dependent methyltransferase [Anaerovorax odorimutans]|uniref:Class I SAM-dependent methyltransferase n=1 Tax=Anaerovorax odorimutans TaxID=109327 RepID=A0ABT1RSP5_9FIRM|nr:class I SAM-dependent methyltransferase [Anaerovorax odorimutans]MCQ4638176.1 class I SAM-dependent methyltransferase [Anaerovorax odorimutans]